MACFLSRPGKNLSDLSTSFSAHLNTGCSYVYGCKGLILDWKNIKKLYQPGTETGNLRASDIFLVITLSNVLNVYTKLTIMMLYDFVEMFRTGLIRFFFAVYCQADSGINLFLFRFLKLTIDLLQNLVLLRWANKLSQYVQVVGRSCRSQLPA